MVTTKIIPKMDKSAEEILEITNEKIKNCIQCGKCSAGCPAVEAMDILPHQVIRFLQIGESEKLENCKSIWNCAACFSCENRCPKKISVSKLMEGIRVKLLRKQGGDRLTPDMIPEIMEDENLPQQAIMSGFRKYSK